jgi:O-antigen ligase
MWSGVGVARPPSTLDRSATLVEIVKFGGACSAFVLGFLATRRRDGGEIALRLLQAMGLAYALWAMSRYVGHQQLYHGGRLTGGFGSPNTAATLMAALAAISAGQMVAGLAVVGYGAERWLARVVLPGLIAMALMSGVALTGSRAGLVFGLGGCGLVLAFAAIDPQTRRARTPLLIGGGVVLALIIAGARLTQDRLEGAMDAASVRYGMLLPHWRAFEQHPLTGHGWGSFDALNQTLLPMAVNFNSAAQIRALHNAYLQTLVEVGVIGLAAFALIVGYVLIVAVRRWSGLGARRALMVGTLAACLVFLAHAAFDYALQVPSMAAQWSWLLGVLLGFGTPTRGTSATKRLRPVMPPRQTNPNVKADGELVDA